MTVHFETQHFISYILESSGHMYYFFHSGVSANRVAVYPGGYRSPPAAASAFFAISRTSAMSSAVSVTLSATRFSSRYCHRVVRCQRPPTPKTDQGKMYLQRACARDRDDFGALREEPSERSLPRRRPAARADILESVREVKNLREVLRRIARDEPPEVFLREVVRRALTLET